MIEYFTLGLICINLVYFGLKKRKFDIFTIFFFSSFYYSLPLFFGNLYEPYDYSVYSIDRKVYIFYGLYFTILLLFIIYFDNKFNYKTLIISLNNIYRKKINIYYNILFLIIFSLLFIFFIIDPHFLTKPNQSKADFKQFGVFSALYIWGSLILFSLSLFLENKIKFYIALFFILLTLFGGSRAYFATALFMYLVYFLNKKYPNGLRLFFELKIVLIGMFLFLFMISYKIIYSAIRLFDFNNIVPLLLNNENWNFRFFQGSEQFQTMSSLQHALVDLKPLNFEYINNLYLHIIPFFSNIIAIAFSDYKVRFNDVLRENFYFNVSYGVAGSFWGEMYYIGSWVIVILSLIFLLLFMAYYIRIKSFFVKIFLFPSVVYISYYIHRNDLDFMLYSLYICIAYFILLFFIKNILFSLKRTKIANSTHS